MGFQTSHSISVEQSLSAELAAPAPLGAAPNRRRLFDTLSFTAMLAALGLACTGATCGQAARPDQPAPTEPGASSAAKPDGGPPRVLRTVDGGFSSVADDSPLPTAADLPGYPLDQVLPSIARQVFAYAKDAFGYDGCQTPLDQCLAQPAHQRHALRMLALATRLAAAGAKNVEIDTLLNTYYASFEASARVALTVDPRMCQGPEAAPVTLVEFSDFECPFCRMARPLLETLVTADGPVRLCFRPFPLHMHPHAQQAAEAALYAESQGKFWPMHDALFEHQSALELADLGRYAADVGLDPAALQQAVKTAAFQAQIDASKAEGDAAKVRGTPSIFFNGRAFDLPLTPENLAQTVEDEAEWQAHGGHWAAQ